MSIVINLSIYLCFLCQNPQVLSTPPLHSVPLVGAKGFYQLYCISKTLQIMNGILSCISFFICVNYYVHIMYINIVSDKMVYKTYWRFSLTKPHYYKVYKLNINRIISFTKWNTSIATYPRYQGFHVSMYTWHSIHRGHASAATYVINRASCRERIHAIKYEV